MNQEATSNWRQAGLMLGALGVVFGDIGTSPLYALRECFTGPHGVKPTSGNVLGILSLIFLPQLAAARSDAVRADHCGSGMEAPGSAVLSMMLRTV